MKFKSILFTSSLAMAASVFAAGTLPTHLGTAYHMTPAGKKVIVQTYQNANGAQRKVLRTDAGLIRVRIKDKNGVMHNSYTNK